ncbi:MAG TPA: hypothetical protein VNC61_05470 [Acidimicrobiales bacterium]|nr:hypothetical protein [Acidimicrobiales bacterium]
MMGHRTVPGGGRRRVVESAGWRTAPGGGERRVAGSAGRRSQLRRNVF